MPQQIKYFKKKLNEVIDASNKSTNSNSNSWHIASIDEILTEIQQAKTS
jgi:hypothetical protein